ncbi:MAG: single-stranded-DNA-specific exonuclease RecJ [Candidatus Omnitrophica bacterium]|nr:single-stranded-DNA-specific exonuclease RecJ [Candidatus Omnitrophota bacterium]MBU4479595.1 single-stranded-DNA-specific exonuclease RecJ [Candidatus Omnitrophota bacterium]MCG2703435.1 single-stranded-DNA-specific exonuclease RecJ [Candidatus Omnitrophota bacterium]MCG2711397.1 single-stranded-DNA-specific exonuclease RecJ [Candidatus Omnitrophota bacterium]
MEKIWNIRSMQLSRQRQLAAELKISPILAQILLNRGIDTPEKAQFYLRCDINDCHDPFLLKDMRKAAERVRQAVSRGEKIFVYGDYDVDGLTSCALLYFVLKQMGADVSCYVPHRVEEGYGVNKAACALLKQQAASLVITVDCGITNIEEVAYLSSVGIDAVITDHHRPHEDKIPDACAVINPLQKKCPYPYKELAGVGLAYKLAQAVVDGRADISEHLDLVALGTVSDVAALSGENRILVKHGLERLSATKKIGLQALMEVAGIAKRQLSAYHIGFILGPRINATGRMGSAEQALRLLLSDNYANALELARALDAENKQRQKEEAKTLKDALAIMEREINFKHHRSVVLHHDEWHPGVIGIVASRIAERYNRPTILISTKESVAKGSGRSIKNFHLFDTLVQCGHLLENFGGHEKAAGLSILKKNIDDFKKFFNDMAHRMISNEDLLPSIDVDMEIALGLLSEGLISELDRCEPFGMANPRPVFASRDLKLKGRPRLLRGNTFKLWITDGKVTCEALAGSFSDIDISNINDGFSITYSPSMNDWQGISTIQLKLKDIKVG